MISLERTAGAVALRQAAAFLANGYAIRASGRRARIIDEWLHQDGLGQRGVGGTGRGVVQRAWS